MPTPIWHRFSDQPSMTSAATDFIVSVIGSALGDRQRATLALAGGKTPIPIFARLAALHDIDWPRVLAFPADDRLVDHDDPLSNFGLIRNYLGETGAQILALTSEHPRGKAGALAFAQSVAGQLTWPIDLLWLGMGADGHTGSILPGPDFERALSPAGDLVAAVTPDPMPVEAPVERLTLSLSGMKASRNVLITVTGATKRDVLERAIAEGEKSVTAISRVLAALRAPASIYWCP